MSNEELLEKIGEFMKPLVSGITHLKLEVSHLKTAVEALKAGQDDLQENVVGLQAGQKAIRAEMATKADIKRLEQKIDQTTKDHEERIEQLELAHHKN
jgi:FtsZ-binding cell division protein ZapB